MSFLSTLFGVESGGQNIPNVHQMTSSGQAQGYFQITTGTWKEFGGTATGYPTPMSAPYAVQAEIASRIPFKRWDPITINAVRARGFRVDPNATLGQNLAANGESVAAGPGGGVAVRQISSNPDAALAHAAGMASPSDPSHGAGLSSPVVPPAPAGPMPMPTAPNAPAGLFAGGGGAFAMAGNPPHEIQPSPPLEAAGAAQQANMKARQMMDFLMPVPEDTATSGKPVPNVFGDAATNPAAAEGLLKRLFASPKLAEDTGGVRYRA